MQTTICVFPRQFLLHLPRTHAQLGTLLNQNERSHEQTAGRVVRGRELMQNLAGRLRCLGCMLPSELPNWHGMLLTDLRPLHIVTSLLR